jgi:hypothetical protein
MSDEAQTIEHANYNPVDYFKNRVRAWWNQVMIVERTDVPAGTVLAAEKTQLLARAKSIRQFIEKLPGMGGFFRADNLDGIMLPLLGVAATAAASVIGAIKLWEQANQKFNHKMTIYTDSRAMGYSPQQSAELAVGVERGLIGQPNRWLFWLPLGVIVVGAGYWFFLRGSLNE